MAEADDAPQKPSSAIPESSGQQPVAPAEPAPAVEREPAGTPVSEQVAAEPAPEPVIEPVSEVTAEPAPEEPEPEPTPAPEEPAAEPEPAAVADATPVEPAAASPEKGHEPEVAAESAPEAPAVDPEPALTEPVAVDEPQPVAVEPELEPAAAVDPSSAEPVTVEPASEVEANAAPEGPAAVEPEPAPAADAVSSPEPTPAAAAEPAAAAPEPTPAAAGAKPTKQGGKKSGSKRAGVTAAKVVEGVVTAVSSDEVELTLDDGRSAVISRRNFAPDNQDPAEVLSPGDRAFGAELSREDPKQRVVLSRTWALKRQAWDKVTQVAGLNETLTGKVVSIAGKGVVVDVGVRGFVPSSHLDLDAVVDLKPYLHQVLELKVLEADPQRERLVLSRRSLLLKEQRKQTQSLLSQLKPGEVRTGKVTSLTDYGAFVDIGGVNGLVHLSELSWKRVRRPADVVTIGQEIEVKVIDVKTKKRRISLSIRRLTPDPLTELTAGDVHQGAVTRLVDFGAFVAIGELEGLVHLSELAEYRVSTPDEVVAPGDEVGVKVLSVDTKRRRIELSIRQAAEFGG